MTGQCVNSVQCTVYATVHCTYVGTVNCKEHEYPLEYLDTFSSPRASRHNINKLVLLCVCELTSVLYNRHERAITRSMVGDAQLLMRTSVCPSRSPCFAARAFYFCAPFSSEYLLRPRSEERKLLMSRAHVAYTFILKLNCSVI